MEDYEEVLVRLRSQIDRIEAEIADKDTPSEIKQFAHRCLLGATEHLYTYAMFKQSFWVAYHIRNLEERAHMTKAAPTDILLTNQK